MGFYGRPYKVKLVTERTLRLCGPFNFAKSTSGLIDDVTKLNNPPMEDLPPPLLSEILSRLSSSTELGRCRLVSRTL
ncbi:hypothetical protein QJS04_geneDACA002533 [Acorus gramineus]|uniref:F-box domain-containing protein n=1 Tax=Acorus gramineus TaxID=55184 RepID=A0AAV9ANJ3_ACOGR|nr:hypothetical protein QJS04_geneDACA002533 [Acorus gramineus]